MIAPTLTDSAGLAKLAALLAPALKSAAARSTKKTAASTKAAVLEVDRADRSTSTV